MRSKWFFGLLLAVGVVSLTSCDGGGGGGGSDPKVNNPDKVQLQPLPAPKSPGDTGGGKPGPAPNAQ